MGALMLQGMGSDVGKSALVTGLRRVFADRRLRLRLFKPRNMSNNAGITAATAPDAIIIELEEHLDIDALLTLAKERGTP